MPDYQRRDGGKTGASQAWADYRAEVLPQVPSNEGAFGATHAHTTCGVMPVLSNANRLRQLPMLIKRHTNTASERYTPIRAISNRDTQREGGNKKH